MDPDKGDSMRAAAFALAVGLIAFPSFAKKKASKGPQAGQYCSKSALNTTAQDASGATLTCKADKKGKPRWTR
jgi:hypothetical protein